jgi:hypothetical protein
MWERPESLKIVPTNVAGKSLQADTVTFVGVLNGSASIVAHEEVHEQITVNGSHYDVFVGSGLLTCMPNASPKRTLYDC